MIINIDDDTEISNAEVVKLLFDPGSTEGKFKCKLCNSEKVASKTGGHSNLLMHLETATHKDQWRSVVLQLKKQQESGVEHGGDIPQLRGTLDWMLDEKVSNIFKWADLMSKFDTPFSWSSDKNFLKYSNLKGVDSKTIDGNLLGAVFQAKKKQRLPILAERPTSKYIKLGWIPCTTCEVERLFSKCRHIFSEFRKGLNPETMEIILYLRMNRAYWDIGTVGEAIREWDTANPTVMAFLDVGEEDIGINNDEE